MNVKKKRIFSAEISELHDTIYSAIEEQICDIDRIASFIGDFMRLQDESPEIAIMIVLEEFPGRCKIFNRSIGVDCMMREAETFTTTHDTYEGGNAAEITFFAFDASIVGKERELSDLRSTFFGRDGPREKVLVEGEIFDRSLCGPKGGETFFCFKLVMDVSFHDNIVEIVYDEEWNRYTIESLDELKDHINKRRVA